MAIQQYSSHSRRSVLAWILVLAAAVYAMSHVISRGGDGRRVRLIVEVEDSAVVAYDGDSGGGGFEERSLVVKVPECDCEKTVKRRVPTNSPSTILNRTTCSEGTAALGPGQRVAAYTYYEDETYDTKYKRDYFSGVAANVKAVAELLPGDFRVRLYYQIPSGSPTMDRLCRLACKEEALDICDVERNPKYHNAR